MSKAASGLSALVARGSSWLGFKGETDSLRAKVARGSTWIFISYGSEIVFRFLTSVIVTRLLDPAAYGLIAVVMVFVMIPSLIADLGFRPIIQTHKRGDEPDFINSIWIMQIARGVILTIVIMAIAFAWEWAQRTGQISAQGSYGNPLLPSLLAVVGVTFLTTGFNSINEFRLARHLQQGEIARLDIGVRLVNLVVTIALAYWLRSVWALALAAVINSIVRAVFSLITLPGPRPSFRVPRSIFVEAFWDVLSRSKWIALTSALAVAVTSIDKLIISYVFDVTILGVFVVGATLFEAAQSLIARYHATLGISFMKHAGADDKAVGVDRSAIEKFYKFRLPADVYCVAGAIAFVFLGQWVVDLLYDDRYALAGHYIALLGAGLAIFPLRMAMNIPLAQQRFKYCAAATLFRAICFYAGMAVAAYYKSMTAMVLVISFQLLPEYLFLLLVGRTGVPFVLRRDAPLLLLAILLMAWCLWR